MKNVSSKWFSVLFLFGGLYHSKALKGSTPAEIRDILETTYSKERNTHVKDEYEQVRRSILSTFKNIADKFDDSSVHVNQENFTFRNGAAWNCILRFDGNNFGTDKDRPALLGAHYDSVKGTIGVDDNGSGMVALVTAAGIVAEGLLGSGKDKPENTLIFVAFDVEETGLGGSGHYVQNTLQPYLVDHGIAADNFQGALILETIMNFNATSHSQSLPPNSEFFLTEPYKILKNNSFRGDFLSLLHRTDDKPLAMKVLNEWTHINQGQSFNEMKYKAFDVSLPADISGRPTNWTRQTMQLAGDFLRSDHVHFWDADAPGDTGLKALFITDTANFRGYMKQCYHESCDSLDKVTDENLEFLSMTTDVMAATMLKMGGIDVTIEPVSSGAWSTLLSGGILQEHTTLIFFYLLLTINYIFAHK